MATINHRYRDEIHDWSTYDLTKVFLLGEIRYFHSVLTGIVNEPLGMIGDGVSRINQLPFFTNIVINASASINLETLKLNYNKVIIKNISAGNINVNFGTASSPDNYLLEPYQVIYVICNSGSWQHLRSKTGNLEIYNNDSDALLTIHNDDGLNNAYVNIKRGNYDYQLGFLGNDYLSLFYKYGDILENEIVRFMNNYVKIMGGISGSTTTITSSSDNLDVSGIEIFFCDTGTGTITIGGFSNGVVGQKIMLIKLVGANNLVLEHLEAAGDQQIVCPAALDYTFNSYGGALLVCSGTTWRIVDK